MNSWQISRSADPCRSDACSALGTHSGASARSTVWALGCHNAKTCRPPALSTLDLQVEDQQITLGQPLQPLASMVLGRSGCGAIRRPPLPLPASPQRAPSLLSQTMCTTEVAKSELQTFGSSSVRSLEISCAVRRVAPRLLGQGHLA